ncbi:hypothetical protein BC826DRAFT_1023398 [Russula brevipes]|nr:hypothetical protein BC826DRAFT_1023398 [Russula brevipes]
MPSRSVWPRVLTAQMVIGIGCCLLGTLTKCPGDGCPVKTFSMTEYLASRDPVLYAGCSDGELTNPLRTQQLRATEKL